MKRVIAALLLFGMVITIRAVAERELYAPTVLAPIATAGTIEFGDGTAAAPSMTFSADNNTGIYRPTTDTIGFTTNGNVRAIIDGYNMCVGNNSLSSSPQSGFVSATSGNGTNIGGANLTLRAGNSTGTGAGGYLAFQTAAAGGVSGTSANTLTERMRITSDGEVGIGKTPSAGYMLDVNHATDARIALYNGGSRIGILQAASSLFTMAGVSTNPIAFQTNGAERMRIASDGVVSVGGKLSMAADAPFVTGGNIYGANTVALGTTGSNLLSFFTNSLQRMQIASDGQIYVGNGQSAASPTSSAIRATNGSGTDIGGANMNIYGGVGTGSGAGGVIALFTSAAGSTGTSLNSATERMRITSDGNIAVGHTAPISVGGYTPRQTIAGTDSSLASTAITQFSANSGGPGILLSKSRNASIAGQTIVSNGDTLGTIRFAGSDGTDMNQEGVRITAEVDGNPASDSIPGRLIFMTTAVSGSAPLERARLNSAGLYLGNGETNVSPANGALRATGGAGTNIAGGTLIISGGTSTGSGAGGPISFRTSTASGSGSTTNTATEKFSLDSTGILLAASGSKVDTTSGKLALPNGTALPATCVVGEVFDDTDSNDCANTAGGDGALCICKTTNTWALLVNF